MSKGAAMQPDFVAIEMEALEHVWIHSARWLDLAERDGLRVMVRAEGCRLFDAHGRSYLDGFAGLCSKKPQSRRRQSVLARCANAPWRYRRRYRNA